MQLPASNAAGRKRVKGHSQAQMFILQDLTTDGAVGVNLIFKSSLEKFVIQASTIISIGDSSSEWPSDSHIATDCFDTCKTLGDLLGSPACAKQLQRSREQTRSGGCWSSASSCDFVATPVGISGAEFQTPQKSFNPRNANITIPTL